MSVKEQMETIRQYVQTPCLTGIPKVPRDAKEPFSLATV